MLAAEPGVIVSDRKQGSDAGGDADRTEDNGVDQAFDLWLTRGLHQLYDTVVSEQVPEEWLRMIEADRTTTGQTPSK